MNILITGGRAAATMDFMRSLISQEYQVYSAESMLYPFARFVKGVKKHFVLPKPSHNLAAFIEKIKEIIIEYKIDLLIPTCEEIFYISQGYEELSKHTRVFCEPFERLNQLHDKYTFNQLALEYGLTVPQSWLISTHKDKQSLPTDVSLVLKPVRSRLNLPPLINPSQKAVAGLPINESYIAQEYIQGREYSIYAIVHEGEVLIQSCYYAKYRSALSSGIYFEPAEIKPITEFIKIFCQRYQFSGQIAFDFILVNDKAYAIGCNPRINSGFHFLADKIDWHSILNGQRQYDIPNMQHMQPFMLGQGMMLHSLNCMAKSPRQFTKDYRKARDILKNKAYPWFRFKSMLRMLNMLGRAIRVRKGFYSASLYDIDFS